MSGSVGYSNEGNWLCGFGAHKDGWNGDVISVVIDLKAEVKTGEEMSKARVTVWTQ